MTKNIKRYWKYSVPEGSSIQIASAADLAEAYALGNLKVSKKSDEDITLNSFEVMFDNETGRLKISYVDRIFWSRPELSCPDCDGKLHLNKKFFKIGSPHSPWFYICSNREEGCKTVVPAKKSGELTYPPVSAEIRNARKITSQMFDRLWMEAPDIASWVGPEDEMNAVINKGKARAYRFLANKMSERKLTKNINQMTIEELRVAYVICRDSNLDDVIKF